MITTINDLQTTTTTNEKLFIFVKKDGSGLDVLAVANCESGASPAPTTYSVKYDTTTNLCKLYTTNLTTQDRNVSFPVAILQGGSSGFTSIDQIFNCFGYIGSTVFALSGIKGLIPNGRNEDGSVKNIEVINNSVLINTFPESRNNWKVYLENTTPIRLKLSSGITYLKDVNRNYYDSTNAYVDVCCLGSVENVGSLNISNFRPYSAFQAVDRNDISWLSRLGMPSNKYINLTLGASNSTYTAPANGYFSIMIKIGASQGFLLIRNESNILAFQASEIAGQYVGFVMPAKQRDEVLIGYNNRESTAIFRFIYAEGEQ